MRRTALLLMFIAAAPVLAMDNAAIDRYVQRRLDEHLVRGAEVVIVRDGRFAYSRAFGEARSGTPMTVDTPVIIGSLSKAFTATAVLQLRAPPGWFALQGKRFLPINLRHDPVLG